MKVMHVITRSEPGGAQTVVRDLAQVQQERGHDVLIASGGEGAGGAWEGCLLPTLELPALVRRVSLRNDLAARGQLEQAVTRFQPDILHLHTSKAAAVGRLIRFPRRRIVYTMHGFGQLAESNRRLLVIDRLLRHRAGAVVAVSQADAALMRNAGYSPVVIHNGCRDARDGQPSGPPAEIIREQRRHGQAVVLLVARDAPPKRVNVARQVANALQGAVVAWLGGYPGNDDPGSFLALGVWPAPPLMCECDLFLLLSDHEGMPASLVEALSAGLPAVLSDLPGTRETMGDSGAALFVPNSARAVSEAIQSLLADPGRMETMSKNARELWERKYRVERMADDYHSLYERLNPNAYDAQGGPRAGG